jgi:chemotaxis regulatin CheY-phosphate phosphatase CheZ
MLTLDEMERAAYVRGDTTLAGALAARIDAEDELAAVPAALEELQDEIGHLKRILRDALKDDCWRERAAAAIAD